METVLLTKRGESETRRRATRCGGVFVFLGAISAQLYEARERENHCKAAGLHAAVMATTTPDPKGQACTCSERLLS